MFTRSLYLALLVASDVGCRDTRKAPPTNVQPEAGTAAPNPVDGRGIAVTHEWTWFPKPTQPLHGTATRSRPSGNKYVEVVATLNAAAGYLRSPAESIRLTTAGGMQIAADLRRSSCRDLLALGETSRCSFEFEIPSGETPATLSLQVPPEASVSVGLTNPAARSGPCTVEAPCNSCVSPASGTEFDCRSEHIARGLVRVCSFENGSNLAHTTILYCPPGYRLGNPPP
jgi:hypothetical protein